MVLDVFVEGYDVSMNCRYSGFTAFRCEIFRGWNEELGRLYQRKYRFIWDKHDNFGFLGFASFLIERQKVNDFDIKMKKILDEYDRPYNEGMKILFYHSDCDGEITPDECVLVLKSFQHVDVEKFDKSDESMNEWYREMYDTWTTMLTYAIENNKSILFG